MAAEIPTFPPGPNGEVPFGTPRRGWGADIPAWHPGPGSTEPSIIEKIIMQTQPKFVSGE